ncbi:MAG: 50S ribosome-binding GTPase [Methanomassiliicoccaceae archaeon]|jgi:nucleolar GTP-binding protein|nr:50S ribosome-binding GTPase [Methanomassiliicoccaceae archaeon]
MASIPTVLTSDEMLDKAFSRASKIEKEGASTLDHKKKTALAKVTASGDIVVSTLNDYVDRFPRIEKESDFFPELVDLTIGIDQYKQSLGAMKWAANRVERLKNEALRNLRRTKDIAYIESIRGSFYGRLSSILKQIAKDLLFLQDAKNKFRKLPAIKSNVATAVIAGFPNVGKSKLVSVLSTAAPEIAPYPFTTKGIIIGHIQDGWRKYQVIDTPGLLDRDLDERNDIEKQAILALKYLTHVLVFILDPSEQCGYPMDKQLSLLRSVEQGFRNVPMVVAESKSDIHRSGSGRYYFSAETGENMDGLRDHIMNELRKIRFTEEGE